MAKAARAVRVNEKNEFLLSRGNHMLKRERERETDV